MDSKKFAPILPFDGTLADSFRIYDQVKYVMDINLVGDDPIRQHSPFMIKYYRCETSEPVLIGGDV